MAVVVSLLPWLHRQRLPSAPAWVRSRVISALSVNSSEHRFGRFLAYINLYFLVLTPSSPEVVEYRESIKGQAKVPEPEIGLRKSVPLLPQSRVIEFSFLSGV